MPSWTGQECGMQYLVVATKHHEGFAMYRYRRTPAASATPPPPGCDRRTLPGLTKAGLRFGLYCFQDLDWHDPDGGVYLSNDIESADMTWATVGISGGEEPPEGLRPHDSAADRRDHGQLL